MCEDVTQNMARMADARHTARELRRTALCEIEGEREYERQQEFLATAARVAREGRLSRFVYVSKAAGPRNLTTIAGFPAHGFSTFPNDQRQNG